LRKSWGSMGKKVRNVKREKTGVSGKKLGVMKKMGVTEKMGKMRRPRYCRPLSLKSNIHSRNFFCFSVILFVCSIKEWVRDWVLGVSHMEIGDKLRGMFKFSSKNP